jgi:spore germination protein KB
VISTLTSKISRSTALMIIILSTGLMNHVIVIPLLLDQAGRDAWLSVLLAIPPLLLWIGIIYCIMRKTNYQSLPLLIQQRYGKAVLLLIAIPLMIIFIVISFITLKDATDWISSTILRETPIYVIAISILLLCSLMARAGIFSISQMSAILLPIVILLGFFVMTANFPQKHYSWMLPVLENGWGPVWKASLYVAGGTVELLYVTLLQQHIKHEVKLWHLLTLGLFLIVLTMGPLIGAITEFGPQFAMEQRYPAYEEWRLAKIGRYFEHLEFLATYQWMAGLVIRIAVSLFLAVDILNLKNKRARNGMLWGISFAVLALALLPISDIDFYSYLKKLYFPVFVPCIAIITLIFLFLSFKKPMKPR